MLRMMLRLPASISIFMASRYVAISFPTVRRPFDGRLTVGNEMATYREAMKILIDAGKRSIILNMAKVDYVDSTGLGALVMSYTTLHKAGGQVRLLNLTRRSIELLVMTKLTTIFEVFDDEQNAVNSFFPDREI